MYPQDCCAISADKDFAGELKREEAFTEMDGALIVFDAATLREVKRIPMRKPAGKYNVYNKITRSSGASH